MTGIDTRTAARSRWAPIGHREAMNLAETAYRRLADLLGELGEDDWSMPTDCEGWAVRDLAGHVLGAMRAAASVRELLRQQREIAKRVRSDGVPLTDAMTAVQVQSTAGLSTQELVAECHALVPKATAGRRRVPAPARKFISFRVQLGSIDERWRLGYLIDVILTRDAWMHRVDLCRAIGAEPEMTPEHDGRLISDVAEEWARRHGQACNLVLAGPAGGSFSWGDPAHAERIELDAVEFCRILSGRARGTGLLATEVPF